MKMTFTPRLVDALHQLPVVESWTETACDGLWVLGAIVVAEKVIGKS